MADKFQPPRGFCWKYLIHIQIANWNRFISLVCKSYKSQFIIRMWTEKQISRLEILYCRIYIWHTSPIGRGKRLKIVIVSVQIWCVPPSGSLVKWLRHRPFTARTVGSTPPRVTNPFVCLGFQLALKPEHGSLIQKQNSELLIRQHRRSPDMTHHYTLV